MLLRIVSSLPWREISYRNYTGKAGEAVISHSNGRGRVRFLLHWLFPESVHTFRVKNIASGGEVLQIVTNSRVREG